MYQWTVCHECNILAIRPARGLTGTSFGALLDNGLRRSRHAFKPGFGSKGKVVGCPCNTLTGDAGRLVLAVVK